ncbi:MAG: hypothetical protein GF405_00125, partial [Candidatus Eisenbacteria bacterium]|nr:hypothetical protein [Candidatus Eisenbacteria bacterium]
MRSVRTLVFLALVVLIAAPLTASARWVDLGTAGPMAEPEVELLASDASGIRLSVDLPGFVSETVATDRGVFAELTLPGHYSTIRAGSPELPVIREYIEIPWGATPRLSIVRVEYAETTLEALGIDAPIIPVQPSVRKVPGAREAAAFQYDEAVYAADAFTPDVPASLGETGTIRAHSFVELEIFPVQYNTATGAVRYLTDIEVAVDFEGGDWAETGRRLERYASPDFDVFAQKHFVNADQFRTRALTLPIGYIIVVYDDYYEEIQSLAGLRHRLGYETTVVKTSEIPGGATKENIQAYILDAYTNWDTPPTFVLLVGDTGQIPAWTGSSSSSASNLYYGCMDAGDDWLPDIYVGRFSCDTEAEVTLLTEKTTDYTRFALSSGADWIKEATFMASTDNHTVSEGTHNYVIDTWLTPDGYTSNKRYYYSGATTQQVIDDVNGGISMLTYSGHGSVNSWADGPPMDATDVNGLTNAEMLPMVQSYSCLTGSFDSSCFGETWTLAPYGGVLFLGASTYSYWDEDDIMERAVYDAWFGNDYTWARGMFNEGLWAVYEAYSGGGRTRYYYEAYTVFGDPALDPWTDPPQDLYASYDDAFPIGGDTFSIDVTDASRAAVENALVCLYMDGQLYETQYTDATGHADITISTPPTDVGAMDVWVGKHNYKPYSGSANVIVPVTYTIDPPTVPINTATDVTVTVLDSLSNPVENCYIEIDGWGVSPISGTTGPSGDVVLSVNAPYGEDLTIYGQESGESYHAFDDVIPVTGGTTFGSADVDASVPSIGLTGMLAPHYEGTITGTSSETGFDLYAAGCGVDASTSSGGSTTVDLLVTPTSTGTISTAVAKSGFDIYLEDVTVQVVYGQLSGTVNGAVRDPIAGAAIKGYAAGADTATAEPVFETVSAGDGTYTVDGDLEVDYYDVYVSKFGYLTLVEEVFVQYGANVVDFYLDSAPSGIVSGTVTQLGTGLPLEATIKVYRADTGELYTQVTSDTLAGGAYSVELPYFNYSMFVRSYHHIPETRGITVDGATQTQDFVLEETLANILVIDDLA